MQRASPSMTPLLVDVVHSKSFSDRGMMWEFQLRHGQCNSNTLMHVQSNRKPTTVCTIATSLLRTSSPPTEVPSMIADTVAGQGEEAPTLRGLVHIGLSDLCQSCLVFGSSLCKGWRVNNGKECVILCADCRASCVHKCHLLQELLHSADCQSKVCCLMMHV